VLNHPIWPRIEGAMAATKYRNHKYTSCFFFVLRFVGQGKHVQIQKNSSKHKKYLATRGNLNEVVWSCFGQYLKKEIFSRGEKDESMNE